MKKQKKALYLLSSISFHLALLMNQLKQKLENMSYKIYNEYKETFNGIQSSFLFI